MLRIDCWEAEKNLKTTPGSECALTSLAIDEPLEYAKLYLDGNLQMWVDAEDSLELFSSPNFYSVIFIYFSDYLAWITGCNNTCWNAFCHNTTRPNN